jgi:hypothetical protein
MTTTNLSKAIGDYATTHLQCRDFGHAWAAYTVERLPQRKRFLETLRCSRCRTHRLRVINHDGTLAGGSYQYATGYRLEGVGRLDAAARSTVRLAVLNRLIDSAVGGPRG